MIVILAVYTEVGYFLQAGWLGRASWAAQADSNSPAGYYPLFVTQALFLGLVAIALWKWAIWVCVLRHISRLKLQLDSTNGDLTGGLGFLGEVPRAFVPIVLAMSR